MQDSWKKHDVVFLGESLTDAQYKVLCVYLYIHVVICTCCVHVVYMYTVREFVAIPLFVVQGKEVSVCV